MHAHIEYGHSWNTRVTLSALSKHQAHRILLVEQRQRDNSRTFYAQADKLFSRQQPNRDSRLNKLQSMLKSGNIPTTTPLTIVVEPKWHSLLRSIWVVLQNIRSQDDDVDDCERNCMHVMLCYTVPGCVIQSYLMETVMMLLIKYASS